MIRAISAFITRTVLAIIAPFFPLLSAIFLIVIPTIIFDHIYDTSTFKEVHLQVIHGSLLVVGVMSCAGIANRSLPNVMIIPGYIVLTSFSNQEWYSPVLKILTFSIVGVGLVLFLKNGITTSLKKLLVAITPNLILRVIYKLTGSIRSKKSFYLSSDWVAVRNSRRQADGECCAECGNTSRIDISGKEINYHVDHILPRSKFPEFALDFDNTRVLCNLCNTSKGAKYGEKEAKLFINNLIKSGRGSQESMRDFYYHLLRRDSN